ncbi:MAG: transcription termination/antitermination factor NusG [Candidatus Omnitrophica bacterium]|nr:transcription termination/antitermination factor NusG [Candidatus Omnitrophota bacterium]
MAKRWYVIHTQAGYEERVQKSLGHGIQSGIVKDLVFQVLIPTETVSEVKAGKKNITERKFFPGYVLVEMELNDTSWYFIKNIQGVTGFVGSGTKPLPLSENEVKNILRQTEEKKEKPMPKVIFQKGETIRVAEGPFASFNGMIEEVNPNKGKLKVSISIFGRSTPVELEYWQVEKT